MYCVCKKLIVAVGLMAPLATFAQSGQPNILVVWGDDVGQSNISAYTMGVVGYRTPNIDRIAREGMIFTDYYGEQSCTAGRSSFITGQSVFRTGLSKVGLPGADLGLREEDPTIAAMLKTQGYAHIVTHKSRTSEFHSVPEKPTRNLEPVANRSTKFAGQVRHRVFFPETRRSLPSSGSSY